MNKQIQVLGSQETENLRDRLLKQAGEDEKIKRIIEGRAEPEKIVGSGKIINFTHLFKDTYHPATVNAVSFSQDGKYLAVGCDDGFVHLFGIKEQEGSSLKQKDLKSIISKSLHYDPVNSVSLSPNGDYLATASKDFIVIREFNKDNNEWDYLTEKCYRDGVCDVAFSPGGKYLAAGGLDQRLHVYEFNTREIKQIAEKRHSGGPVFALAFGHDIRYLVTACGDMHARVFEFDGNKLNQITKKLHSTEIHHGIAFSHDDKYIAVAERYASHLGEHKNIAFYEFDGKNLVKSDVELRLNVNDLAFSPNGKYIALAYDTFMSLWQINREKNE